jgi:microcystin-dependent protein
MSYNSGINQRTLEQEFFDNTTAVDQPTNASNGSLIANLTFVRNYVASVITGLLPVNNPNFTGSLTSSSGGNITLANPFSYITTPSLTSPSILGVSTFNSQPRVSYGSSGVYPIETRVIGEIKILLSSTAPPNYIACKGVSLDTTTYSALFSVIGYTYGGSGVNFNVPDFTNYFLLGANGNINGVPVSNLATGDGQSGAINTSKPQSYFGGSLNTKTPLLQSVPPHTHLIQDPSHSHNYFYGVSQPSTITPLGTQQYLFPDTAVGGLTSASPTGISILSTGTSIQSVDPVSNLGGINITPPYIAVNFFIAYQ